MRPYIVFTGPTLPHAEARQHVDAVFLPPAVQGSVVTAVKRYDPGAIVVIDGGFQSEPAIRHREILWALHQGIAVIGAASMGALRAAELFPHMQGVGLAYRWYRRCQLAPDDAVAVLHGPPELDFPALTESLLDLRLTFRAARRRGLIAADGAARLDQAARTLNFRERTLAQVIHTAFPHLDTGKREQLRATLAENSIRQKKKDAQDALRCLRDRTYRPAPDQRTFVLTTAFARDLDDAGLSL